MAQRPQKSGVTIFPRHPAPDTVRAMIATADQIAAARRALRVYCPDCKARAGQACNSLTAPIPPLGVHDERIRFLEHVEAERTLTVPDREHVDFPERVSRKHGRLRSS